MRFIFQVRTGSHIVELLEDTYEMGLIVKTTGQTYLCQIPVICWMEELSGIYALSLLTNSHKILICDKLRHLVLYVWY